MSAPPIPIEFLRPEDCGVIVEMNGEPGQLKRLEEIGIRIGANVRMVSQGVPCMVCIEGRRLSLRLDATAEIFVAPAMK